MVLDCAQFLTRSVSEVPAAPRSRVLKLLTSSHEVTTCISHGRKSVVTVNEPPQSAEGTAGAKLCSTAIFLSSFQDYQLMHQPFHGLASMANTCRAFSTKHCNFKTHAVINGGTLAQHNPQGDASVF